MYSARRDSVKRHIAKVHDGTGVIVSFIDYLVGRFSGAYAPGIRPTYMNKKTATTTVDYADTFRRELIRGLAERVINNHFNPPQYGGNSAKDQPSAGGFGGGYHFGEDDEVFGLRTFICDRCLLTGAIEVRFTNDRKVAKIQGLHVCNPVWVEANNSGLTDEERKESIKRMTAGLTAYLHNLSSQWTAGQPTLLIRKLKNPSADSLRLRHPAKPDKTIALQPVQEGIIELRSLREHAWIQRAINSGGKASLQPGELVEFCNIVKNTTFGFFKIYAEQPEEQPSTYLLMLANRKWMTPSST